MISGKDAINLGREAVPTYRRLVSCNALISRHPIGQRKSRPDASKVVFEGGTTDISGQNEFDARVGQQQVCEPILNGRGEFGVRRQVEPCDKPAQCFWDELIATNRMGLAGRVLYPKIDLAQGHVGWLFRGFAFCVPVNRIISVGPRLGSRDQVSYIHRDVLSFGRECSGRIMISPRWQGRKQTVFLTTHEQTSTGGAAVMGFRNCQKRVTRDEKRRRFRADGEGRYEHREKQAKVTSFLDSHTAILASQPLETVVPGLLIHTHPRYHAAMADISSLFVTRLYRAKLSDYGTQIDMPELVASCYSIAEDDEAGQSWSEKNGYPGYTSYASLTDLPWRFPVFADMVDALNQHVAAFAQDVEFDLDGRALVLEDLWINILPEGGMHSSHIHPHSVVSGTTYVQVPDGAGALKLEDPRHAMMMAAPARTNKARTELKPFVYVAPRPGEVVLWESWLRHEVPINMAEDDRISVSFNYRWE